MNSDLTELIRRVIRYHSAELHVMLPGVVKKYDHKEQRADVQPMVKQRYLDELDIETPIIVDVPVIFPRSGGASFTFPVEPGDPVMIIFADRDCDKWIIHEKYGVPEDHRQHSMIDAVAIPGLIPFSVGSMSENNTDVLLTYKGTNVRIKRTGYVEIEAPHVKIDAPMTQITGNLLVEKDVQILGDEYVMGNIAALGWISTGPINLTYHTHPGVQSGTSFTGPPV